MSNTTAILSADMARRFLSALDPDGAFTFQTFDDNRTRKSRELARIFHGTLEQNAKTLVALNEQGAGIFVMVNEGDLTGRTARNVRRVRALFVDLDGAPLEPILQCPLPPHIVVDSSPGRYHAYWLVDEVELAQFKSLQCMLATRFDGDASVQDLPRVMRLPGFLHRKAEPHLTTVRSISTRPPYTIDQLVQGLGLAATTKSANALAVAGIPVAPDPTAPCAEGERNTRLTSLVGVWLAEGKTSAEVLDLATSWNNGLNSPLPHAEVRSVCESMQRTHERNHPTAPPRPAFDVIATSEWEEPVLFDDRQRPDIPASVLPGELGRYAAALATATETPEALAVFAVLGVVSAAVSKRFVVVPKAGWREPINVYVLIALPPANNKSAVLNNSTMPLREWETEKAVLLEPARKQLLSERRNQEKLIDAKRAQAVGRKVQPHEREALFREITELEAKLPEVTQLPQLFANDATPESLAVNVFEQDGRFAVISDEGGIMETLAGLYSGGMSNIDLVLKGIDGGDVRVRRKDRSFDLKPYLTFLLVVQPRIIQNMGERLAFRGNGMLERFIYVLPPSKLGYRSLNTPPIPDEVRLAYHASIGRLLELQPVRDARGREAPRELLLSCEAAELFGAFHQTIEAHLRPGGALAGYQSWAGKLAGYTLRFAGLLHVAEFADRVLEISKQTMIRAITVAAVIVQHAQAAFDLMGVDQTTEDAKVILDWIKAKGQRAFKRTDCHRGLHGRFTNRNRLSNALRVLTDRHIISEPEQHRATEGKRATTYYRVNPAVLEGST